MPRRPSGDRYATRPRCASGLSRLRNVSTSSMGSMRLARARNAGPLRDAEVLRLFREIMSACVAQQEPLKVAFLGPEGTFTQTAVLNHFGHSVRALPLATPAGWRRSRSGGACSARPG